MSRQQHGSSACYRLNITQKYTDGSSACYRQFNTEIHGSFACYRLNLTQKYTRNNATRHAKADLEAEKTPVVCMIHPKEKLARERKGKKGGKRGGEGKRRKGIKT